MDLVLAARSGTMGSDLRGIKVCSIVVLSLTYLCCPLQSMQLSFLSVGMMLAKEPGTILVLVTFFARCSKPFGTFTHWVSAPIFIYISYCTLC